MLIRPIDFCDGNQICTTGAHVGSDRGDPQGHPDLRVCRDRRHAWRAHRGRRVDLHTIGLDGDVAPNQHVGAQPQARTGGHEWCGRCGLISDSTARSCGIAGAAVLRVLNTRAIHAVGPVHAPDQSPSAAICGVSASRSAVPILSSPLAPLLHYGMR